MKRIIPVVFLLYAVLGSAGAQTDKPKWVDSPAASFPGSFFVAAVGSGRDRRRAETGAFGSLASYFRQSVINSVTVRDSERQENGRFVSSVTEASQTIEAVAVLDSLIGAEIKDIWNDERRGIWYAVAVMEKTKCAPRYSGEIDKTIFEINSLIDISDGISFETISKCRQAQSLVEKAGILALIHSMLGGQSRQAEISALSVDVADTMTRAKTVPVDVRVISGDRNERIRNAFAGAFTDTGFRIGNRNSRYTLEVTMVLSDAPKNQYYNTRYTVNASLKDTQNETELFAYNIATRASHTQSQDDADNRAYIEAERKIKAEFPGVLRGYLESN